MQSTDELSNILLKFKLIPLQKNSKLPIGQWKKNEYSPFDFVSKNKAIIIGDCYCVLDVEGTSKKVSGYERLRDLENQNQTLPDTLSWSTPSGGMAYLFKTSRPVPHSNMSQTVGLELRTGFHYHLIPDSEIDGKRYEWESITEIAEVPKWLVEFFQGTQNINKPAQASAPSSKTSSVVIEALYALNPNCSYEQWVKIGMACKASGMPLSAWQEWSSTAENACKDVGEYGRKWNSFIRDGVGPGSLIRMARETGWEPTREEFSFPVAAPVEPDITEVIFEEPQGLLKDLQDHFFSIANQEQYALGAALFCLTAVCQRSYRFQDAPQNAYHVLIGESGARKSSVMNAASEVIQQVAPNLAMSDPRSIANFKKQLSDAPSRFLAIDEIGQELLKSVYGRNASPQAQDKFKLMLELHGYPRLLQGHGTASKETKTTNVHDPRLSLIATGTHKDFEDLIAHREFTDGGLFSRMVVWKGLEQPPSRYVFGVSSPKVPEVVVEALKALKRAFEVSTTEWAFDSMGVPADVAHFWGEFHASEILPLHAQHKRARSLVDRSFHQGLQFGYLHAVGCNRKAVTMVDAVWGSNVALGVLKQSLKAFGLYQEDRIESGIEAAIQFLKEKGSRSWRDLYKNVWALKTMPLDDRLKVYTHLLKSGTVFLAKDGKLTSI